MKQILLFFTLLLAVFPKAEAQGLPVVSLQDINGRKVDTRSLADGKSPFVLTFWMTTCKPCMKELEALTDEALEWKEPFPLRIYAVSVDDSRSLQRAVAMARGGGWVGIVPLFDVNGDLRRALNVTSVPQVFVYGTDGRLVYTHIGYLPGDEAELLKQLKNSIRR